MTKKEILALLKYLNSYYGNRFEIPNNQKELGMKVETWYNFLKDYDYKSAETVTNKIISVSKWAPTPGEIVREVENMKIPEQDKLEAGEAWEMVLNSIAQYSYFYNPKKVKDSLPDKARRAAEAVGFALIAQEGADNTFLYNHFKEIYNGLCEKENHNDKLPSSIRKETAKLANRFRNPQLREGK